MGRLFSQTAIICFKLLADDFGMSRKEVTELFCEHKEADTQMFYHSTSIVPPSNVVIRTADTDCPIIGLESTKLYHEKINIWIEAGTQSSNSQKYSADFLEMSTK